MAVESLLCVAFVPGPLGCSEVSAHLSCGQDSFNFVTAASPATGLQFTMFIRVSLNVV